MSGFSAIIQEKTEVETKNHVLEYLSDIMEDSHIFYWQSAKSAFMQNGGKQN